MSESARFHSPDELLATARALLASGDESVMRACVLEAITALEAMVGATVFPLLRKKLPEDLVVWLDERTKMDFDTRLSVLIPVATGKSIEKDSDLWRRYKSAKQIRNQVTHLGRIVTVSEAKEVLSTVEDWLNFLGSMAEVNLSMEALKEFLERRCAPTITESEVLWLIADYYRSSSEAKVVREPYFPGGIPDAVLRFGEELVIIEIKVIRGPKQAMSAMQNALSQAGRYLDFEGVRKVAVFVVFVGVEVLDQFHSVTTALDGRVSVIGIQAGNRV